MEIVLIRHGQPKWVDGDQYDLNPGLTELGKIQADKSASLFSENSFDELWVSPLKRAQETMFPFKEKVGRKALKLLTGLRRPLMMKKKSFLANPVVT